MIKKTLGSLKYLYRFKKKPVMAIRTYTDFYTIILVLLAGSCQEPSDRYVTVHETNNMKTLIVYVSVHHQNTLKIAKSMAEVLNANLKTPLEIKPEELNNYDLIGFGSGIYMWKHHKDLLMFVENLSDIAGKKAFIFSTSGDPRGRKANWHKALRDRLLDKGFNIIDEFNCVGWDNNGLLKIIGGINKGRPNDQDLGNARNFAKDLLTA